MHAYHEQHVECIDTSQSFSNVPGATFEDDSMAVCSPAVASAWSSVDRCPTHALIARSLTLIHSNEWLRCQHSLNAQRTHRQGDTCARLGSTLRMLSLLLRRTTTHCTTCEIVSVFTLQKSSLSSVVNGTSENLPRARHHSSLLRYFESCAHLMVSTVSVVS